MRDIEEKVKNELKEIIEWVLLPINGKVIKFNEGYEMTHRSRKGNEPWKEWKEYIFHIDIDTDNGETFLTTSDIDLQKGVWRAIQKSCHEFIQMKKIDPDKSEAILRRIYLEKFRK